MQVHAEQFLEEGQHIHRFAAKKQIVTKLDMHDMTAIAITVDFCQHT